MDGCGVGVVDGRGVSVVNDGCGVGVVEACVCIVVVVTGL